MSVSFWKRLKMAWNVFRLREFDEWIEPYRIAERISGGKCDFNSGRFIPNWVQEPCENRAEFCVSRVRVRFEVDPTFDHIHVCRKHAIELTSRKSD